MKKYFTLLIGLFIWTLASATTLPVSAAHEFHISKCQIEYSVETEALQITLHLYLDDLEEALRQQGADKMFLCTDNEHEKAEKYLFQYLQQQFKLIVNEAGEEAEFEFIGKEQSEDLQAVWCYLEVTNVSSFSSLEVTNSLLMEIFDDQKNIVQIMAPGKKQGYFLFHKGQENDKVTF